MNNSFNLNQSSILNNSSNVNTIVNTNVSNISSLKKPSKYRQKKKTFQEIQINFLNSLNSNLPFEVPDQNIPFDDYVDVINTSMNQYQLSDDTKNKKKNKDDDDDEDSKVPLHDSRFISKDDTLLIKKMYDNNRSFISKNLNPYSDESLLKINIPEKNYKNPYQSLNIIANNHNIYDEVSKDFLFRQKRLFDESIKNFEGFTMKYKVKMPKIKVVSIQPKVNFEIPVVNLMQDNKKKEVQVLPQIPTSESLKLFAYYKYPHRNFPEGRQQFSLTSKEGEIYLVGGMSSSMKQLTIWKLNLEKLEWSKIKTANIASCRYGHTGIIYQNKLYLFGGLQKFSNTSLCAGFEMFSFQDNLFSSPALPGKTNPCHRRGHIAETVGQQMLIYGGIDDTGEILNDCFILNFNPLKWFSVTINPYSPGPKVYGHASSIVIQRDVLLNHRFNIYKYPDNEILKNLHSSRIKERGMYVFGGKSKEEGGLSNELWILIMGKKPLEWVQPVTKGKPPCPRYYHTMNYYEKGNFLIVHGGRNDDISATSGLNDTFIFDLENFEWMKVELYSQISGFQIYTRYGHSSIIFSNKLIILGGMNNSNYLGSSILILNLDFYYTTKLKTAEELMIDKLKQSGDPEDRKKIDALKKNLRKNQLGVVTEVSLPPIK